MRIIVVGGGIGGLSAALSLRRAGFEVDVYEQAPELTQIGGGINMGPNAVRILRRLGLAAGLDREGVRPLFTHQRHWQDGRTLQRARLNPLCEELYGARITADILVGADGFNSVVRTALFGEEAPGFAGCVAYRGLVPAETHRRSRARDRLAVVGRARRARCALLRLARAPVEFRWLDRAR